MNPLKRPLSADPYLPSGADVPAALSPKTIDRVRLDALLTSSARTWPVEIVDQTTSTNADLLEVLRVEREMPTRAGTPTGLVDARVRVAYEQTAGRGRRGRTWVARPGDALLFSVAGWLPRGIEGLGGLSLAVGLAVHDALRALPVDASRVALKWPNDVLVDGAKVSGILIETARSTKDATALVVGIGINLRGAATLAREIAQSRAASATPGESAQVGAQTGASGSTHTGAHAAPPTPPTALDAIWLEPSMTDLLARLLDTLAGTFDAFAEHGFAPLRAAWCAADSYRDKPVALYEGGEQPTLGMGRGVDDSGYLLIETAEGVRTIASGDVSLRAA